MHFLPPETFDAIRQFDTCTVANAIEMFGKPLRNVTDGFPRLLGYAATCRVRASDPPIGGASYDDRIDLKAFHCEGVIPNGSVRDLPEVIALDFPRFAGSVGVSHSYAHLVDFGNPAEVFGLSIRPGDPLYADCHGAISIPLEIAPEIPKVAAEIRAKDRRIVSFCQSPDFSPEKLLEVIR